jgi:transposase
MQTKSTTKLFEDQKFFIGIDTHKKNWNVSIYGEKYFHKSFTQNPEPDLLSDYMKRNFPGGQYHAVYEASFNGFGACRRLNDLGVECIVIHPADVPTSLKEKLQKTDKVDSKKLAKSLRAQLLEGINIPDVELESDRALLRQRFRVSKEIARNKNRVKSLLFQFGIKIPENFTASQSRHWSKVYLNWLKELEAPNESFRMVLNRYICIGEFLRKELLLIYRQIRLLSRSSKYKKSYDLLISIPGIGITSAMTILLELGDIRRFKSLDKLNNFIGLVPKMHGSGEKMKVGKIINRGRKEIKIILIEASWHAVRLDPAMMAKFNELSKKMNKNKAIIRIARKLLSRVRHILLTGEAYKYNVI